jgi:hypothetical protein
MTTRSKVEQLKRQLRLTRDGVRCPECGRAGPEDRGAEWVPDGATPDERAELLALLDHILEVARRRQCRETFCRCGRQRLNSALFAQHINDATWDEIENINRRVYHRQGRRTPFEIASADRSPTGNTLPMEAISANSALPLDDSYSDG